MLVRVPTFLAALLTIAPAVAAASTMSYTGALMSPEDVFYQIINVPVDGTVTLQTYGFGGGTNAAGTVIGSGGFDPLVALFSGTGPSATIVDGTSDTLSNYPGEEGCPPAGTVTIGAFNNQCGDVDMSFMVTAGTYTVLLSDANYQPAALVSIGPTTLGDGFFDLTGGVFQTCVDTTDCISDSANWALDITIPNGPTSPIPEPATYMLLALALPAFAVYKRRSKRTAHRLEFP